MAIAIAAYSKGRKFAPFSQCFDWMIGVARGGQGLVNQNPTVVDQMHGSIAEGATGQ